MSNHDFIINKIREEIRGWTAQHIHTAAMSIMEQEIKGFTPRIKSEPNQAISNQKAQPKMYDLFHYDPPLNADRESSMLAWVFPPP